MKIHPKEIINEVWQAIPENRMYAVSSLGRVASAAFSTIRVNNAFDNGKGYKCLGIRTPRRQNLYVHRLVARAFISNPENKPEVNHKDGDKSNNRVSNLEWVTLQENRDHSKQSGFTLRGSESPASKLTEVDVMRIKRELQANPNLNKSALGRRFGVGYHAIRRIADGAGWKHVPD